MCVQLFLYAPANGGVGNPPPGVIGKMGGLRKIDKIGKIHRMGRVGAWGSLSRKIVE